MPSSLQNAFFRVTRVLCRWLTWLALPCIALAGTALAQAPPATIGRITGDDISVSGPGGGLAPDNPHSILLASGSEITVHSGQARIDFVAGGDISICGPAKLTLLDSGGPTTLALNFGRVHVHLAGDLPLTVFTPTVVAIPLALSEGPRDAIIGLDGSGAMCVRAVSGGVSLEQQLTGETFVVPQPKEVFFDGGQLKAVPGAAGTCQCNILATAQASPPPPFTTPKPETSSGSVREPQPPAPPSKPAPPKSVEYSVPARTSEVHKKDESDPVANLPAREAPVWKVMMPPLTFDAASTIPPPSPGPETILLVREVVVEPAWIFHGRVEAGPGQPTAKPRDAKPSKQRAQQENAKKNQAGGIRGFFRRLFGGGSTKT